MAAETSPDLPFHMRGNFAPVKEELTDFDLKVTGAAELFFPIPFAKEASVTTRLSWFLDFGQVYRDLDSFDAEEIRYTTGISLQWQAPVGPVIINLVAPLNDKDGDETETLQFAFGNFF